GYLYGIERGGEDPSGRWRFRTGGPVTASAATTATHVFTASTSGNVFAILPDDGANVWRFEIDSEIHEGPAVAEEWLYFGATNGSVYAIRSGAPVE
ncbi:MAG: PQQ-binding-like beta-propeller repeat protein, partial [Halobacteriota archaeon]